MAKMKRLLTQLFFFKTIGSKIAATMFTITALVLILSTSSYLMYDRVHVDTTSVSSYDIPNALISTSMRSETGDMRANILEYILGDQNKLVDFEKNKNEFLHFLATLKSETTLEKQTIKEIENLFDSFYTQSTTHIFSRFSPSSEAWARQRVQGLTDFTGTKLERLLDDLKQKKVESADLSTDYLDVLNTDLPSVRYYLELLDEAGDMVNNLILYIDGSIDAKRNFIQDSQSFEEYFALLKPLAKKTNEIISLNEVEALYSVLRDGGFEVFGRYNPKAKTEAIRASERIEQEIHVRLDSRLRDLASKANQKASSSLLDLRTITRENQVRLLFFVGLVILCCIILTYSAYRTITLPISELSASMRSLSEGDTKVRIRYFDRNDEVGSMAKAIEVFKKNIIARNLAEKQLLSEKERAEEASRAKANFLATMSHEIRTPMNGIIGMIDLIHGSNLNHDQKSMANTIRDSAFSLLNIINDILDFSKIEAGKLNLEHIEFSPFSVAEGVMDTLIPNAIEKNVEFELFTDPTITKNVIGDPVRLRQVLFNLVGNAIKFSSSEKRKGIVRLSVELINENPHSYKLLISVKDNGIGMDSTTVKGLFQAFSQAESSTTRRFGGTGLGLAICRNLIELMNGEIKVNSTPGAGSTFQLHLTFPCGKDSDPYQIINPASFNVCNLMTPGWHSDIVNIYLRALRIHFIDISASELASHNAVLLTHDKTLVIITDNYTLSKEQLIGFNFPIESARFLILEPNNNGHGFIDKYSFSIGLLPLKIASLIHGINVARGVESPVEQEQVDQPENKAASQIISQEEAEARGNLILIAEDNITNQDVIKRQLAKLGLQCRIANDGIEAEALYKKYNFGLVLTDCHMPNRDGYELTQVLRQLQQETEHRIPIIAFTANALVGEAEKCIQVGMDDYLSKPIEIVKLKEKMRKWLPSSKNIDPLYQEKATLEISTPEPPAPTQEFSAPYLEPDALANFFLNDKEDYLFALTDFRDLILPQLSALVSEVDQDFDLTIIKQLAHKLKSSSATIGAQKIATICGNLEACDSSDNTKANTLLGQLKEELPSCDSAVNQMIEEVQE